MRDTHCRPRRCGLSVRSTGLANLLILASALSSSGLFSGCASVAAGNHQAPAALKISVVPSSVDFKEVVVGQKNTQTLHITNSSDEPISFEKLHVSGQGFTFSAAKTPVTVPPGATFPVTVAFAPTATAPVSGSLVASSSDLKSQVTVPLAGSGEKASPQLQVLPTSLNFGVTNVHSSATQNVTLKNTGNISITINSVAVSNSAYSATGLSSGVSLAPGQTLEFNLTFRPATAGVASATLSVGSASLTAPAKLNLWGSGATPPPSTPNPPSTAPHSPSAPSSPTPNPPTTTAPSSNPPTTTAPHSPSAPSSPTPNPPTTTAPSSNPPTTTPPSSTSAPAPLIGLSWNASTSSVVGYHVYRSATSGGPYTRISGSVISSLGYQDGEVVPGSRYYYVVTALDSAGTESAFSNEASASVPNP